MTCVLSALILVTVVSSAAADSRYRHLPSFAVPKQFYTKHNFHPVGYIESMPVKDTDSLLTAEQQQRLAHLFFAADDACRSKYHQGYYFQTSKPAIQLLLRQFPDLQAKCSEFGMVIYSGNIADYLRERFPDFRSK